MSWVVLRAVYSPFIDPLCVPGTDLGVDTAMNETKQTNNNPQIPLCPAPEAKTLWRADSEHTVLEGACAAEERQESGGSEVPGWGWRRLGASHGWGMGEQSWEKRLHRTWCPCA